MLTQVNEDGYNLNLMEVIIDYNNDKTYVPKEYMYVVTKSGMKQPRKTTVGWKLLVQWKDNFESWINLKYMKVSHPVEVAYFDNTRGSSDKPSFEW